MNNNLGKILIDLRERKGYTQKDLANKLNVSDKAVSRWETGASFPHVDILVRISKLFKINLQDLIVASTSVDDNGDNLVQDIIKEFTRRDENKSKLIKILISTTILIVLVLTIAFIFTKTYNRFKVYNVYIESNEIVSKHGIYVETRIRDVLVFSDIYLKNYTPKNTDTIIVDLYIIDNDKEKILHTYNELDGFRYVSNESYEKIENLSDYHDSLYIRVKVLDKNQKEYEFNGKLQFVLDFSNSKMFYKDEIELSKINQINMAPEEIKEVLLKNGFEDNNGILVRNISTGIISFFLNRGIVSVYQEIDNYVYKYSYNINKNIVCVSIFNAENIEIENYTLNAKSNKVIECNIGSCKGTDKVLELLNKDILCLLKS